MVLPSRLPWQHKNECNENSFRIWNKQIEKKLAETKVLSYSIQNQIKKSHGNLVCIVSAKHDRRRARPNSNDWSINLRRRRSLVLGKLCVVFEDVWHRFPSPKRMLLINRVTSCGSKWFAARLEVSTASHNGGNITISLMHLPCICGPL